MLVTGELFLVSPKADGKKLFIMERRCCRRLLHRIHARNQPKPVPFGLQPSRNQKQGAIQLYVNL